MLNISNYSEIFEFLNVEKPVLKNKKKKNSKKLKKPVDKGGEI